MNPSIRTLVDLRDRTIQKSRIAFGNRVSAIERGTDNGSQAIMERWSNRFAELEEELDQDIAELVGDLPIVERMIQVKGIGFTLAAKLVAMIDIEKADTVSALWRYAGYAVIDGAREKPVKGEKLHYNIRLKTTLYLVATSFLRSNSPYRAIYDEAREYYAAHRLDWTKGHQHNAAMRKMIKVFLAGLWLEWRKLEGLPLGAPYIIGREGHEHYRNPQEFGWPE